MRFPRAAEVPFTAGISGLVFVFALFSVADPVHELIVFGTWGLVYVVECLVRRNRQDAGASSASPRTTPGGSVARRQSRRTNPIQHR